MQLKRENPIYRKKYKEKKRGFSQGKPSRPGFEGKRTQPH